MINEIYQELRKPQTQQNANTQGIYNSRAPMYRTSHVKGMWKDTLGELTTFHTSSAQTSDAKKYFYEVWGSASIASSEDNMFSVAYGHISGSGSLNDGGEVDDTPTRAIYSQYRLLCLDNNENFVLANGKQITDFYVINFNRDKMGEKLDPGNFEINLAELNGGSYINSVHTGSNVTVNASKKILTLIDDSGDKADTVEDSKLSSIPRNLVSGSLDGGIHPSTTPHYYGLVYPDKGYIIIDAAGLNLSASFNTVTGSNISGDNSMKVFKAISGSAVIDSSKGFAARSVSTKNCSYYFINIPNDRYNYTSNPTYVSTDSTDKGKLKYEKFQDEPITYITAIGLYNDDLDLIAVAKMSKPVQKSLNSELSITVKLEY
jgi:hypothetical protein